MCIFNILIGLKVFFFCSLVDRHYKAPRLFTVNTEYTVKRHLRLTECWWPTFSLETFPCSRRCWALGKSGSNVPVLELREYFLVKPPWNIRQCQACFLLVYLHTVDFVERVAKHHLNIFFMLTSSLDFLAWCSAEGLQDSDITTGCGYRCKGAFCWPHPTTYQWCSVLARICFPIGQC